MKKLANLNGVKTLSKMQQRSINGGFCSSNCVSDEDCESCNNDVFLPVQWTCFYNQCIMS